MKVHVIGGGPAGLYFAILMKKAWPQRRITVFERNRPDDTFGFGVVFSDQTLDTLRGLRPRELPRHHRPLRLLGRHRDPFQAAPTHRIGGNGFCGCSRVDAAARSCGRRARALGVEIKFQTEIRRSIRAIRRGRSGRRGRRHQFAHPRRPSPTSSSRASTCGRTSSPGWARPGRSTPSRSSSARPSTASSSRTATSTSRGARPGSSRPTRRPSRAPASTQLDESASARSSKACSPRSSAATG